MYLFEIWDIKYLCKNEFYFLKVEFFKKIKGILVYIIIVFLNIRMCIYREIIIYVFIFRSINKCNCCNNGIWVFK